MTETHAQRRQRLEAEGAAAVAKVHAAHRARCEEWDRAVQQRRDEDQIRQRNADALTLAYRRTGRQYRRHLRLPVTVGDARAQLADTIETLGIFADDPRVLTLKAWVVAVCGEHQIEVRDDAAPQLRNGVAFRTLKRIVIAPIQSLETAAVAAHEIGHVLCDVDPLAPVQPIESGLGRVCVSDELHAWRWVLTHVPIWDPAMHTRMTECLAAYRRYATEAEAHAIDALVSNLSYRQVRLRLLTT